MSNYATHPFGLTLSARPNGRTGTDGSIVDLLRVWVERSRTRRDLARLDARLLLDIGIDPADAAKESRKPFWVA